MKNYGNMVAMTVDALAVVVGLIRFLVERPGFTIKETRHLARDA